MFIDSVTIFVKGGNGGKGCYSIYRDKYTRKGIPNGGPGGKGADIIIRADRNLHTLLDLRYNRHFYGDRGVNGSGNDKKGRDAGDFIIRVPVGTVIKDIRSGCVLRDLDTDQEEVTVARGGKGGAGNMNRQQAEPGESGEERNLLLDLKVMADVGVIGFPNAGKSTLITSVSNAHPKVASYPFTTTFPVLGFVTGEDKPFVIADIPGLIKGSCEGRGLGDTFLRHVERTRLLLHLIDMAAVEGRDPVEDYRNINKELERYSKDVGRKPQLVVANKMDLAGARENLKRFKRKVKKIVYPVSALEKQGLEKLLEAIKKRI